MNERMNERLKDIRKSLKLSQDAFSERIGMKGSSVSLLESGKRNITEPVIKSICREFGVDYVWFTTGDGEMFVGSDDDIIEAIDRVMIGENEFHKNLFKTFARLDEDELLALEQFIDKFIEISKEKD
ncbi:MAG: helix-turn-helix transcriptional regulator [Lachnospiraceae bacterium]